MPARRRRKRTSRCSVAAEFDFINGVEIIAQQPYDSGYTMAKENLGNLELMVLLALLRIGSSEYGVPISREIQERTGRNVAIGSVYAALERLERKGLVSSTLGDPSPERGGRAKRYFQITGKGVREVREAQRALTNMWRNLAIIRGEPA
jgi:PadR family transcriptional regulator PadR